MNTCPLCSAVADLSAVTRMDGRTAICEPCAALEDTQVYGSIGNTCLWFDESLGIVRLIEGQAAYIPLFPAGDDPEWSRHYVHETNDRLGRGPSTVSHIALGWLAA